MANPKGVKRPSKLPPAGVWWEKNVEEIFSLTSIPTVTKFLSDKSQEIANELNKKYPKDSAERNNSFIADSEQGKGTRRSRASVRTFSKHGSHIQSKYRALDIAMAKERDQ